MRKTVYSLQDSCKFVLRLTVWLLVWNSTEKSPRKTPPKSAQFLEVSSKFEPGYPSRGSWFGRPPEAQTEERCSKWERLMAQICLFLKVLINCMMSSCVVAPSDFFFLIKMLHDDFLENKMLFLQKCFTAYMSAISCVCNLTMHVNCHPLWLI